jgi:hypothetical protein
MIKQETIQGCLKVRGLETNLRDFGQKSESGFRPRFPDSNVFLSDLLGCSGVRSRSSLRLASYAVLQGSNFICSPIWTTFVLS